RVELIDQAELTQQADRFEGGRLEYFIDQGVVQARSDVSGSEPQRIRMTLQPEQ
ncbi:MAG: lipopolysaccharide transport periplasmic protein LptA, partial [Halomonas venusta]|nr:lipopolysaccharide transport periplasmic protein LptA [Halomonas venusta]